MCKRLLFRKISHIHEPNLQKSIENFKYNITLCYIMFGKMNVKIATDLEELEYFLEEFKKSEKSEEMIDISDIQACYFNNVISMLENMNLKHDIIRFDKFVFLKVLKHE